MAYLFAHGTPLYAEDKRRIQVMLDYGDTIQISKNDIYIVRFSDPPFTNDGFPISLRIVYIQSLKKNFRYAFPVPDELCYLDISPDCHDNYHELDINLCKERSLLVSNINYIFNELAISRLDQAKIIVHTILGEPINNEDELQSEKTMDLISDPHYGHQKIKECCSIALDSAKSILKIKNENIELLESQFRGVWKSKYMLEENIIKINLDYILIECNAAYPMGYLSYHKKMARDSLEKKRESDQEKKY